MIINHNLLAINSQNQIKLNEKRSSNTMTKLSSGFRINKAADAAAGLAISEKMRAQIRGLTQAAKNIQDGISLLQVADAGLANIIEPPLQRMRELIIKAGNDTLNQNDRQTIQDELDQIKKEINGIATNTHFNGIKVLDKTANPQFLISQSSNSGATYQYENVLATPPVDSTGLFLFRTNQGYPTTNADDNQILVYGNGVTSNPSVKIDGTVFNLHSPSADITITPTVSSNGTYSTTYHIVSKNIDLIQSVNIIQDKFQIKYTVQNNDTQSHNVGVLFNIDTKLGNDDTAPFIVGGAIISNATEYLGNSVPTDFTVFNQYVMSGGNSEIQAAGILRGTGIIQDPDKFVIGNYLQVSDWNWIPSGSVGDSGYSVIWNERPVGQGNSFSVNTFYGQSIPSTIPDPTAISNSEPQYQIHFQVGANTGDSYRINLVDAKCNSIGISDIKVDTHAHIDDSLLKIDNAIATLSQWRSTFGAHHNALEHTMANVNNATENLTKAESCIRDLDMEKEIAEHAKNSILQEVTQAMFAQANQQPQKILELLK